MSISMMIVKTASSSLNSLIFYCLLSTLPTIAQSRMVIVANGHFGDENGIFASAHSQQDYLNQIPTNSTQIPTNSTSTTSITITTKTTRITEASTNATTETSTTSTTSIIPSKIGNDKPEMMNNETPIVVENREKRREEFYRKVQNVPIQDEHALFLYQHWADQAFSNFFAVLANQKLKKFKKPVHDEFGECSKRATTVPMHAQCLSDLINGKFDGSKYYNEGMRKSARFDKYRMLKRSIFNERIAHQQRGEHNDDNWVGGFRMMRDSPISDSPKRIKNSVMTKQQQQPKMISARHLYDAHRRMRRQTGIVKKNYYELLTPSEGRLSPVGKMAQKLMKEVLKMKGKQEKDIVPWQQTVDRIKSSAKRRKTIKKDLEEGEVNSMDQLTYRGLKRHGVIGDDLNELMENPEKLEKFLKKKRSGKDGAAAAPIQRFVNLLRDGIKLGYAFAGKNSTELENKTLRMASPRFMSVTPEDDPEHNETIDFLSPSLFSIHGEGKGIENLTSLPNLMRNIGGPIGFSAQDQQMWMDFIMEASGVIEDAQKIEEELNNTAPGEDPLKTVWEKHFDKEKYQREIRTKDGTPLYFTKQNISDGFADSEPKKIDLFEMLHRKIDQKQIKAMNKTGFALLSKEQLELLYGPKSPYADKEVLQKFMGLERSKILEYIERDIHTLAQVKSFKIQQKAPTNGTMEIGGGSGKNRRKRQVVLAPITFTPFIATFLVANPIILSPIIFSPLILAPAVFGPVILSPWAFVPLILSPRVLSPLILSPPVFTPLILTPLALHPIILSPGAFAPFILSPVVLAPFILSPQVFTPLILSPLALSPFILNPGAAGPIVLSPTCSAQSFSPPSFFRHLSSARMPFPQSFKVPSLPSPSFCPQVI